MTKAGLYMEYGILVSTPDLRPSFYSILKGLDEATLLKRVVTTLAFDPKRLLGKCVAKYRGIIPSRWRKGVEGRIIPDFLSGKTTSIPARELFRLLTGEVGNNIFANRAWLWSELNFDREVAKKHSGRFRYIYGMEHSSLETFAKQKKLGGLCILRAVMAHGKRVASTMLNEIGKFPEHASSYGRMFQEDAERALVRKEKECRLADLIIANSSFVRDTFVQAGLDPQKVVAIPTGCPPISPMPSNAGEGRKPLVFLFAGTLSLRKGLPYLLKSWRLLKAGRDAELWLVGHEEISFRNLNKNDVNIRYFGSVPKSRLAEIYERADVLVLPTLLEGLADVLLEALSYGMPVITTRESGCGDFVQDGYNGFLIKPGDAEALCEALKRCLERRQRLPDMGRASIERARSWTAEDSSRAHLDAIREFLKK